jgi:teichoic acid transport system ATP-binding protein
MESLRVTSKNPVVVVDDVHVTYRVFGTGKRVGRSIGSWVKRAGLREIHAVTGVSIVVHEGETIGLIGSNGSGKSSLLRAIAGLEPPTKGRIYATSTPSLLGVGAVLLPNLSGEKNIILGALALGFKKKEIESARESIIEFSDLSEHIDLPMRTYSAGMSAKLRFSITASKSHDILIIDEALSVGDKHFQTKAQEKIIQLREEAGTVFLVSHTMSSIEETCTRVLWMDKGKIIRDGNPKEVCAEYTAFMENKNGE